MHFNHRHVRWGFAACLLALQLLGSAWAAPRLIDLSPYCNYALTNSLIGPGTLNGGNNLASLPKGTNAYASVPFFISGVVQLTGKQAVLARRTFPERIAGIKIDGPAARLHLLHGAGWNELEDTAVAKLVVHFSDGTTSEIPIIYGKHVLDWWESEEAALEPQTKVAWTGVNKVSSKFGANLRLYRTTFANPKPGAVIDHIDYVSTKKESAPFLLGLTLE